MQNPFFITLTINYVPVCIPSHLQIFNLFWPFVMLKDLVSLKVFLPPFQMFNACKKQSRVESCSSTLSAQCTAGTIDKTWDAGELAPSLQWKWPDAWHPRVFLCSSSGNISSVQEGHKMSVNQAIDFPMNYYDLVFCKTNKDSYI